MKWAQDNALLSDFNLSKVFRYEQAEATVVKVLRSNDYKAEIWSRQTDEEWDDWLDRELPRYNSSDSGLVLLIAKRTGEPAHERTEGISIDQWIREADIKNSEKRVQTTDSPGHTFEKGATFAHKETTTSGSRSLRTLPFERCTFNKIAKQFHVHDSIARTVSRADVPAFLCQATRMSRPAYGKLTGSKDIYYANILT